MKLHLITTPYADVNCCLHVKVGIAESSLDRIVACLMFNEPLSGMALNSVERRRESFIASIDQGTTSSRVLIFDVFGTVVAQHQVELIQHYPHPG